MMIIKPQHKGAILPSTENSTQRQSSAVSFGKTLKEFQAFPSKKQTISMDSTPTTSRPSTTATTTRVSSSMATTRAATLGRNQQHPDSFNKSVDQFISGVHLGSSSTQPPTPMGQGAQKSFQQFHQHYGESDSFILHNKNVKGQKKVELNHQQRSWTEQVMRRICGMNEKNQNNIGQIRLEFDEVRNNNRPESQKTLPQKRDINQIHLQDFLPKTMKNAESQDKQKTHVQQNSSSPKVENIQGSSRGVQSHNDVQKYNSNNETNSQKQEKNQILFKIRRRHSINGEEKFRISPLNITNQLNVSITTKDQQRDQSSSFSDFNFAKIEGLDENKTADNSRKNKNSLLNQPEVLNKEDIFNRKNDKRYDCFLDSFQANQKETQNHSLNKRNQKQNEWLQAQPIHELINRIPEQSKRVNSANECKRTRQLSPAFVRKIIPQDYTFKAIVQTNYAELSQQNKLNYTVGLLQPYNSQQDNKFLRPSSSSVQQRENTSNIVKQQKQVKLLCEKLIWQQRLNDTILIDLFFDYVCCEKRQELSDLDEFSARIKAEKKFNKQLSKMRHTSKGFCGITMQENSMLTTVEGFKRVKAKKYEPSYPFCLSFDPF